MNERERASIVLKMLGAAYRHFLECQSDLERANAAHAHIVGRRIDDAMFHLEEIIRNMGGLND